MQVISTLGELAAKIQECNDALTDIPWAGVWQARRADAAAPPADAVAPAEEPPRPPERTATELSLAREIEALHRSTSWRITAPLRALKRLVT